MHFTLVLHHFHLCKTVPTPVLTRYPVVTSCNQQYHEVPCSTRTLPHSTPKYPTVPSRYGDYKFACLKSLPILSDELISIKPAFSSMKIVQNNKENMLRSAFDSTYIFLLKIKILFGFCTPSSPRIPQ